MAFLRLIQNGPISGKVLRKSVQGRAPFLTSSSCPIQVGDLPGGPSRPKTIDLTQWGDDVNEYGPTVGVKELREAVAVSPGPRTGLGADDTPEIVQ